MNILKKIALGAVIMLAGVFALPGKVWAADPGDPKPKVTLVNNQGTITYSTNNCSGKDYSFKFYVKALSSDTPTLKDTKTDLNGQLTADEGEAIEYLGNPSETKSFNLYVEVENSSGKLVEIDQSSVTNLSIDIYVGHVTAGTESSHIAFVMNGSSVTNVIVKTISSGKTYYEAAGVKAAVTEENYYIKSTTPASTFDKGKEISIANKVADGDVVVDAEEIKVTGPSKIPTITSPGQTVDIATTVDGFLNNKIFVEQKNFKTSDGFFGDITCTPSYDATSKKVTFAITGDGFGTATAILAFKFGYDQGSAVAIKEMPFTITLAAPTVESITIDDNCDVDICYDPDDDPDYPSYSYYYTATVKPDGITVPISWNFVKTKDGKSSTGAANMNVDDDGEMTLVGTKAGVVYIQASAGGKKSEILTITIHKLDEDPETIDEVEIYSGPTQIVKGGKAIFKARVYTNAEKKTLAKNQDVVWTVDSDGATIDNGGNLILTSEAYIGEKIKVTATSRADSSCFDSISFEVVETITVTGIEYVTTSITKGFSLDMSIGKNIKSISPSGAQDGIEYINWQRTNENISFTDNKTLKARLTGKSAGLVDVRPKIHYTDSTKTDTQLELEEFEILNPVIIESGDTDDKIVFTLPNKVYTSYSGSDNIKKVTGYRIDVLNSKGESKYDKTIGLSDNEKSKLEKNDEVEITLSSDTVENYVESASSGFSGDDESIKIRISPYGTSQTSGSATYNTKAAAEISKTAYLVSVSGSNIVSSSIYALPGHTVKVTAIPSSGYKFANWSDGSTTSTKSVTIDADNPKSIKLTATANSTGTPSSTAGNSTNKNSTNSNLDKVPKTGESMAIYWIVMIAVISGCIAASIIYKYMIKRK